MAIRDDKALPRKGKANEGKQPVSSALEHKYSLNPFEVDAYQYKSVDDLEFLEAWSKSDLFEKDAKGRVYARTPDGSIVLNVGDWLIRGVSGHLYRRTDEEFRDAYHPSGSCSDS